MREQKRKLITIAILALALAIGATFAFTAFNQQAINDRANELRSHAPGRIHDYYNRDTGNKDIFAENYGHDVAGNPIMVRIRLSEYMATQRLGADNFTPIVDNAEREDTRTWTPYRSAQNDINVRTGDSQAFADYIDLTFGWQRAGQEAPWYMPTFNHDIENLKTAAAGHARDYIQGGGAKDGETDGTTHPGDGTDAYWTESGANSSYTNTGTWPGATITQETKQHLQQERPPMTIQQWEQLSPNQRFGNFWVLDHNTGWAYWAELLEQDEATSYLLDAAVVREEVIRRRVVNGSYYYAIHVDSQVISPLDIDRFLEEDDQGQHDTRLADFLEVVAGDGNPRWNRDSEPSDFNFDIMRPGRIFTMAGQQFRYLEDMGGGNHMIIRNDPIREHSFNQQAGELTTWYNGLDPQVQDIVVPVASSFTTGNVIDASVSFTGGTRWLPSNLSDLGNQAVYNDITRVVPGGVKRAFALSLADVTRLSGSGLGFPNHLGRVGPNNSWWWLRTPGAPGVAWFVHNTGPAGNAVGQLNGWLDLPHSNVYGGVRPALIIHQ